MQSSSQIITTNKPTSSFFTGRMPFLSPNQQCQSTEGKLSHSMDLLTRSSPGGLPSLSLTTNSSWLPWGRVAMPLISPLMPVPYQRTLNRVNRKSPISFDQIVSRQVQKGNKKPPKLSENGKYTVLRLSLLFFSITL